MTALASPRFNSWQKMLAGAGSAIVAVILFVWLALPGIIKTQAEDFVLRKTGHHLSLATPQINPLTLRLRLSSLVLTDPHEQALATFDELLVDFSGSSIARRALVFDEIRLDGLHLTVTETADGRLNWSPFLDALNHDTDNRDKPAPDAMSLPRIDIDQFTLARARLDVADQRSGKNFSTSIDPLAITLSDVSTLSSEPGKVALTAKISQGTTLNLDAALGLRPLMVSGSVSIDGLDLATLSPYLQTSLPAAPSGTVSASAHYRVTSSGDKLHPELSELTLKGEHMVLPLDRTGASRLEINAIDLHKGQLAPGGQKAGIGSISIDLLSLKLPAVKLVPTIANITLQDLDVDLAERTLQLKEVRLTGGNVHPTRLANGKIDLIEAVQLLQRSLDKPPSPAPTASKSEAKVSPWRYQLGTLSLADWSAGMRDDSVEPPAELTLSAMNVQIEHLSERLDAPLPVRLAARSPKGGTISLNGNVTPLGPVADLSVKITDLALTPLQPYLSNRAALNLRAGSLNSQGRISYGLKGLPNPGFTGGFEVKGLRLDDAGSGVPFLAWQRLAASKLIASTNRVDIGELRLRGLDTQLIIDKEKRTNLARILKPGAPAEAEPSPVDSAAPAPAPFLANIARLRLDDAELEFADYSLILPFGTRIHSLNGSISGLSTQAGRPGKLEFDGEVDDYGEAHASGQIDLFNPTRFMDLKLAFRNVDMPRLSPYTATFAGRKIQSGKLSLDLQYKITDRQLQGDNKLVIDRLTLGERVESASAKDLPLNLAIALLEDSNGRIDLGLPVSGNLDDPQFSYGAIVWKAISNVLTNIVTAPFRALGALFGGDEKLESIVFAPGAAVLAPPEREKLVRLSSALAKRPALALSIRGVYAPDDRLALQDRALRRTLLSLSGEEVADDRDPGPVATGQAKVQSSLESLFAKRVGKPDLAALKEGFRQANPGQLEESPTDKVMSRLSGLLGEKKVLSEAEIVQLKGGDFYSILYQRVRATEVVSEEALSALAKARGDYAYAQLAAVGTAMSHVVVQRPEPASTSEADVPGMAGVLLRLELSPRGP